MEEECDQYLGAEQSVSQSVRKMHWLAGMLEEYREVHVFKTGQDTSAHLLLGNHHGLINNLSIY